MIYSCSDEKDTASSCLTNLDAQEYQTVVDNTNCDRYYRASAYVGLAGFSIQNFSEEDDLNDPTNGDLLGDDDSTGAMVMDLLNLSTSTQDNTSMRTSKNYLDNADTLLDNSSRVLTSEEKFLKLFAQTLAMQLQYLLLFDIGVAEDTSCATIDNSTDYSGVVVAYDGHVWAAEKNAGSCDLVGAYTFADCTNTNITDLQTYTSNVSTSISSLGDSFDEGDNDSLGVIYLANDSTCDLLDNMSCKPSDCP